MKVRIRPAESSDLEEYTGLLQRTYEAAYVDESLSLTRDCFSKDVFASEDTQAYLRGKVEPSAGKRTWLAFDGSRLVGAITIDEKGSACELTGFYVDPSYQGKGIGRQLWMLALEFVGDRDIVLDIYTHNVKTIDMYKRWGFVIETAKGSFYRHWPEWPEGLQAECVYMKRCGRARRQ